MKIKDLIDILSMLPKDATIGTDAYCNEELYFDNIMSLIEVIDKNKLIEDCIYPYGKTDRNICDYYFISNVNNLSLSQCYKNIF